MWTQAFIVILMAIPALVAGGLWVWIRLYRRRFPDIVQARKSFHLRREWLEARFFTLAGQSGKPKGLEWVDCEFEDAVAYARNRQSGQLCALVGVTIRFRAIVGGVMEDNPNVANLRAATAVFHLIQDEWTTDGQPRFNLNPVQAIAFYRQELEPVE